MLFRWTADYGVHFEIKCVIVNSDIGSPNTPCFSLNTASGAFHSTVRGGGGEECRGRRRMNRFIHDNLCRKKLRIVKYYIEGFERRFAFLVQ
jgi:hypothetical protein